MVLNVPGLKSEGLFKQSENNSEGITKKPKENYDLAIHGLAFLPKNATDSPVTNVYYLNYGIEAASGSFYGIAPLVLPDGAKILNCVVSGVDTADTWVLQRTLISTQTTETMASGVFETADTSVSFSIVDNKNYRYSIRTGECFDAIYGARIEYVI